MGRLILSLIIALVSLATAATGVFVWGYALYTRPGPSVAETVAVVPKGAGVEAIARVLHDAGIIGNPLVFRLGVSLSGVDKALKAGEFAFPAAISARGAAGVLIQGKTIVRRLTVAEGLSSYQVMTQLARTEGLEGTMAPPDEGALLPETYHFSYGDSRQGMVDRMTAAMDAALAELWPVRADGLPFRDPFEALILASIVEKETALPEERPRIAGVFVNRLKRGMRLQSDPTVAYSLSDGAGILDRALTRADLKTPGPYNTYQIDGLPPGPICNPGLAALVAVLKPRQTDELYFVADGSGGHVFARTLAEHNRNVAKWRKIRDGQGS